MRRAIVEKYLEIFRCRRAFASACCVSPLNSSSTHPAYRMAKKSRKPSAPLTFDLPESLIARIETCRKGLGFATASEVVRAAVAGFNFESCSPVRDPHRQISVRIAPEHRAMLRRVSRQKDASVGELLRLALEALSARGAKKKA
ncbi:MAG: hypothetical protein EXS37_12310 [Opitutus sp.]|nr:hypothetical protein [Opitutus sp.]